jgi:pimeloyl-ACP methyl ester carboxylesterase
MLEGPNESSPARSTNMSQRAGPWQHVVVHDVEIEFPERGRGKAIFLVHAGGFSDWFRFVGESEALDGFRVIRLRRVGYGEFQPVHLTLTDHARHAATLADRLGLKQIHCVGHSSSCQIGLALAIEQPELVRSLTLLEPAARRARNSADCS